MNTEEQNTLLGLVLTLLFQNFDYNLIDPDKLLIINLLNQFEGIEQCLSR